MTDYDFAGALEKREQLVQARDEAEAGRKAIDEEMKPHLAIAGGRYEGPVFGATLVDRTTTTYDHDAIRKALLMAGVGLDVITAAFDKARKQTTSSSVSARRVGGA